jgi:hypothetical protein
MFKKETHIMSRFQKQLETQYKEVKTCTIAKIRWIMGMVGIFAFTLYLWNGAALANSPAMSIRIIHPENQIDDTREFFDLQTYPGGSQEIKVELFNLTSEPINIRARVSTATTNNHVLAEYGQVETPRDSTLPHQMEDIVTYINPVITIDGSSSVYFPLQVQMPEDGFDGVLAGGINFQMEVDEDAREGIGFLLSFTAVILLWQGEILEPELVLHNVEVTSLEGGELLEGYGIAIEPQDGDGRTVIFSGQLQNIQAAFAHGVRINSQISNLDTGEIVFEETADNMQVVPNSTFTYHVFADSGLFQEGYYLITYAIESDGGSWELYQELFIERGILGEVVGVRWLLVIVYIILFIGIGVAGTILVIRWHKQSIKLKRIAGSR